MKISQAEQQAIQVVLAHGDAYGYGNLITHLQTAWARTLMVTYGMDEEGARRASGGPGYPFAMFDDLVQRGEWDETGARYRSTASKAASPGPAAGAPHQGDET